MERKPQDEATGSASLPAPEPATASRREEGRRPRRRDAQAKARAYVDLWERHVVLTALHGPDTPWRPQS